MVKRFDYINLDRNVIDYTDKKVVIYGRSMTALYAYLELRNLRADILGFTDTWAKEGEVFAGQKVYSIDGLADIENLVIYIATNNVTFKREIMYTLEKYSMENAVLACRGVVYGAGEYDTVKMGELQKVNDSKIKYVMEHLGDRKSKETYKNLLNYRITNDRTMIEEVYENSHKQYFPVQEFLNHCENEVFIDAGGFDGGTTIDFLEWSNYQYKKVYILEADDTMYDICCEVVNINKLSNVEVIKKAAYSCEKQLYFDNSNFASGSGKIVEENENNNGGWVEAVSIDNLLEEATFIKMDIEGAEKEALIGAEATIRKCHPKLAISVYHKEDDLWEIPYYLMKKYPFYKFYLRQYTPITVETVLYATE